MDERTKKTILRRTVLARRSRIVAQDRVAAGRAVRQNVMTLPAIQKASRVLAFASFGAEVPTDDLLQAMLDRDVQLFLPYVSEAGEMDVAAVVSLDALVPGYRGIREPAEREPVTKAHLDIAIVPGVAFDEAGRRLGHGGGFYDRYLAEVPRAVARIGLCFDLQVVDEVPAEPHDERVDYVVTEKRTIDCESRRDE
jgi:5-formyltetrahydrofolate cyclo-ligase